MAEPRNDIMPPKKTLKSGSDLNKTILVKYHQFTFMIFYYIGEFKFLTAMPLYQS